MRTTKKIVVSSVLVLALLVPLQAFAAGPAGGTGQAQASAGPNESPGDASRGDADRLRDGSCETPGTAAIDADAAEDPEVADDPVQDRTRTRDQDRTRAQDGSCDTSATPTRDRDQIREQDRLRDGSCEESEVVVAATADTVAVSDAGSADRLRTRDTLVQRIVDTAPEGLAAWIREMLQFLGFTA